MNTNIICELIVVTYDIGPSLSPFVAQVIEVINSNTKVEHLLTPMGSVLEGKYDDVMELIREIFFKFASDYERLGITIKIDFRASKQDRIKGKIKSVEDKLKHNK